MHRWVFRRNLGSWIQSSTSKGDFMKRFIVMSILAVVITACAFGQAAGLGSISGVVQDASGAAIADASVLVANSSKGVKRQLQTNGDGLFAAPALVPAEGYTVTVSKTGFSDFDAKGITVAVGQTVSLHIDMSVAAAAAA